MNVVPSSWDIERNTASSLLLSAIWMIRSPCSSRKVVVPNFLQLFEGSLCSLD